MGKRIVSLIALIIVPFALTGCGLKTSVSKPKSTKTSPSPRLADTPKSEGYLSLDPESVNASIKSNFENAEKKAKAWRQDAVLYHFSARFGSDLTTGQVTETYTYGSPTEAYDWWTMTIAGKTGKAIRAVIPKEDYLGTDYQPILVRFWKTNYVEALQLAESNGGAAFRDNHPDTEITINLAVGQPKNYLWWIVEYRSLSSEPYRILVNPATKDIYTEDGKPISQESTLLDSSSSSLASPASENPTPKTSPKLSSPKLSSPTPSPSNSLGEEATLFEE